MKTQWLPVLVAATDSDQCIRHWWVSIGTAVSSTSCIMVHLFHRTKALLKITSTWQHTDAPINKIEKHIGSFRWGYMHITSASTDVHLIFHFYSHAYIASLSCTSSHQDLCGQVQGKLQKQDKNTQKHSLADCSSPTVFIRKLYCTGDKYFHIFLMVGLYICWLLFWESVMKRLGTVTDWGLT